MRGRTTARALGLALALALAHAAFAGPITAVQLDLARQKESPAFVKEYMRRARDAGYDTVVLYLEDRVKTASYPYPSDAESYTPDDIRDIVAAGGALGLDLVPVVSPLGHTERFLAHPELAPYGERCGGAGRWGATENPGCFCLENPEARAWMACYIGEVAALFPGRNFHFGFDETWNLGFCSRCRPIVAEKGLAALYMRHVMWAHGLAARLGKRMWMWDDFFEYFDPKVLEEVPRDILMCQWNYDRGIERTGPRAHFGGRLRRDILATYARLGFDCLVCPWFDLENVRTFTEYAAARRCAGFLFTQWEMETDFHSIFFPRALAAAELWTGRGSVVRGDWIARGLRRAFPSVDDEALGLLEGLMFDQSKLKFTTVTEASVLNGVHETSRLRYWRAALAALRRQASRPGEGAVPPDPLSEAAFLEDIAVRTEMAALCEELRNAGRMLLLPDRRPADAAEAKAVLRALRARWEELCARRAAEWAAWRPGIDSKKEAAYRAHFPKLVDELLARPDAAADDEWLLEVDLAMVDTHGRPWCTAEAQVDGAWRTVAEGVWKPLASDHPYAPKLFAAKLAGVPTALRISCRGYGDCGLCHVSLRNRARRLVPASVAAASGRVQDAANLLVDDFSPMRFGDPDCTAAFLDPRRAEAASTVELVLAEAR